MKRQASTYAAILLLVVLAVGAVLGSRLVASVGDLVGTRTEVVEGVER